MGLSLVDPGLVHIDVVPTKEPESLEPSMNGEHFQLSFAALLGPHELCTLRLQGHVRELSVTILVDSSSSHNIMQPRVAEFLGLSVVAINPFSVIVGNGKLYNMLVYVIRFLSK